MNVFWFLVQCQLVSEGSLDTTNWTRLRDRSKLSIIVPTMQYLGTGFDLGETKCFSAGFNNLRLFERSCSHFSPNWMSSKMLCKSWKSKTMNSIEPYLLQHSTELRFHDAFNDSSCFDQETDVNVVVPYLSWMRKDFLNSAFCREKSSWGLMQVHFGLNIRTFSYDCSEIYWRLLWDIH